jgi:hypothetical protein
METNIGSIILEHCRNKRVPVRTLAATINMSTIGLYKMLSRDDIKVNRLITISRVLNHNFFEDIFPSSHFPGDQPTPQYHTIQQLKREIALLNQKIDWYHKNYGLPKILPK